MSSVITTVVWLISLLIPVALMKYYFYRNRRRDFPDYPWAYWLGQRCGKRPSPRGYINTEVGCMLRRRHIEPHGRAHMTIAVFWRGPSDVGFLHAGEKKIRW